MRRRFPDDGHKLLPGAPDPALLGQAGHDDLAREIVRLDAPQRRKRDGILPPADQPRGRTRQPARDLSDHAQVPIIVTALFGKADTAWFDDLRRAHFPAERNQLSAHLTMFHHLAPSLEDELKRRLAGETRGVRAPLA